MFIEYLKLLIAQTIGGDALVFGSTVHAREGAVDGIAGAPGHRMNTDGEVVTAGPVAVAIAVGDHCLGLKPTGLNQRHVDGPYLGGTFIGLGRHRQVLPLAHILPQRFVDIVGAAAAKGAAQVAGGDIQHGFDAHLKMHAVADVSNVRAADLGFHGHCDMWIHSGFTFREIVRGP